MSKLRFISSGLSAFVFVCVSSAAFSAEAPTGSWTVAPIAAKSSDGSSFCSMKASFPDGQSLVLARESMGQNSIALDVQRNAFQPGDELEVRVQSGSVVRPMAASATSKQVIVMQTGIDTVLYGAFARKHTVDFTIGKKTYSYELDVSAADALAGLEQCVENLQAGQPFRLVSYPLGTVHPSSLQQVALDDDEAPPAAAATPAPGKKKKKKHAQPPAEAPIDSGIQIEVQDPSAMRGGEPTPSDLARDSVKTEIASDLLKITGGGEIAPPPPGGATSPPAQPVDAVEKEPLTEDAKPADNAKPAEAAKVEPVKAEAPKAAAVAAPVAAAAAVAAPAKAPVAAAVAAVAAAAPDDKPAQKGEDKTVEDKPADKVADADLPPPPAAAPATAPTPAPAPPAVAEEPVSPPAYLRASNSPIKHDIKNEMAEQKPVVHPTPHAPAPLPEGLDLKDVLTSAHVASADQLKVGDNNALNWASADGLYGSAEQMPLPSNKSLTDTANDYLRKTAALCHGDFAQKLHEVNTSGKLNALEADITCLDGENNPAAAVLFISKQGMYSVITQEGTIDQLHSAMTNRDAILAAAIGKSAVPGTTSAKPVEF